MIMSIREQTLLFLSTVGAGMCMALIYDIFRIFRKFIKHSAIFVYAEDVIYWIIVSFAMFYFMLAQNYGEIRAFTIIGAAVGATLYLSALSSYVINILVIIIEFAIRVITTVIKIILAPIKLLLKIISIPLKFVIKLLKKPVKKCKSLLQKSVYCVRIKGRSVQYLFKGVVCPNERKKKKEADSQIFR